jgi:hypothetical protein
MPNKNYIEEMHVSLAVILPEATKRALQSYHEFANQNLEYTAKNFAAHHVACKAALAHIDYLTKLTQWLVKQTPDNTDSNTSLLKLVQKARLQLLKAQQSYE